MPKKKVEPPLLTPSDKEHYTKNPLAKWVWRANPGACVDCVARDGRMYMYEDALKLERPHPHCKCTLELVEDEVSRGVLGKIYDVLTEVTHGTRNALAEIVTSEGWGTMAEGTADAMEEVWDDPAGRAALLFAGATMLPGVVAGTYAAPGMLYGAMEMMPAGAAVGVESALPYMPQATDFVTSIPPYTPPAANSFGLIGSFVGLGIDYHSNINW